MADKIILVRHGETTGDLEDRYGGWYDDDLTQKGIEQSRQAANALSEETVKVVVASPLRRAQQTAHIIADVLGVPVLTEQRLKEKNHYGILTGMVAADAKQAYPEVVSQLGDRRSHVEAAEHYEELLVRVKKAWQRLNEEKGTVLAVTHGGVLRTLLTDVLDMAEIEKIADCAYIVLVDDKPARSEGFVFENT